jgi:hypothetical protein
LKKAKQERRQYCSAREISRGRFLPVWRAQIDAGGAMPPVHSKL